MRKKGRVREREIERESAKGSEKAICLDVMSLFFSLLRISIE